jgi:hypothetical protein
MPCGIPFLWKNDIAIDESAVFPIMLSANMSFLETRFEDNRKVLIMWVPSWVFLTSAEAS